MFYSSFATPVGIISIAEDSDNITQVHFGEKKEWERGFSKQETPLIKDAISQFKKYFAGKLKEFSLPLKLKGTEFQMQVWNALKTIPYGETVSYKFIAEKINNPKAVRAVGLANNKNPISIIIPCHRVIGKNGKLVGYGGGLDIKETLLSLENNQQVLQF